MSKYFQIGLVALYILLTALAVVIILKCCSLPVTDELALLFMAAWTFFCFSAARSARATLFFQLNSRKPILIEGERLERCLGEVLQRAGTDDRFELLIEEVSDLNAFAIGHHTIVLSRGIIMQMTDDELKGILAHELGHLMSKDCVVGAAFDIAVRLPKTIKWGYGMIRRSMPVRLIFRLSRISRSAAIALPLFAAYFFYREGLLLPVVALVLFVKLFGRLERSFRFLLLHVSRFTEYKQDAYAHGLGYGRELREALYKLTLETPQSVNRYFVLMNSGHPVIYNRIRRLEELEGLR